jgi:glycosyltransferase involved in cell wall biosynthesis
VHEVAIVIPVYQGAHTLTPLLEEISPLMAPSTSPGGRTFRVNEVVLVHDRGTDSSDQTMRQLTAKYPEVQAVWLSRNYGQHAATLAGMASTTSSWIVTMDEDGQHDPADIGPMLDVALDEERSLVYAKPTNPPPHGLVRNATSSFVKWLSTRVLARGELGDYHSYRLVLGEIGRSMAAYCGHGVYLDVALAWVVDRSGTCPVTLRQEGDRPSGYSLRRLLSHFWRLVVTSGTRPLRFISGLGVALAITGLAVAAYLLWARVVQGVAVQGWTSVMVAILVVSGAVLFCLGVISEYLGVAVRMAMGRPPYLVVSDPLSGPLGQAMGTNDVTGHQRETPPGQ